MNKISIYIWLVSLFLFSTLVSSQTCWTELPQSTPDARFTVHDDGTVTDLETGLMWKQCNEGQSGSSCIGEASSHTWGDALQLAQNANTAGYDDWRLPNIKELTSVIEWQCVSPAMNINIFPNASTSYTWSSTLDAADDTMASAVYFNTGSSSRDNEPFRTKSRKVRLVRTP